MSQNPVHPDSVLLLTLDSCRYDSFAAAAAPHLRRIGPLHRAASPSHFTYASHAAIFAGFTPSLPGTKLPYLDSKFAKLFKLESPGFAGGAAPGFSLCGRTIIEGFSRLGYRTLGSGAVRWFDPSTPSGRMLTQDFDAFFYPGATWKLAEQLAWLGAQMGPAGDRAEFVFLNIGETHVPYYFAGAPWDRADNPCLPYQAIDRSAECRRRQIAAVEHIDEHLRPLLARFAGATILACADHGDCWGEDGLWEHGVSHAMTLTVPLLVRHRGQMVEERKTLLF